MRAASGAYRSDRPAVAELAAGAVVRDDATGTVLLLHHRDEDRWCFPKGHVEPGESIPVAAAREIAEETGLGDVTLAGEVDEVTYRFFDAGRDVNVVKTTVYFVASTASRTVRPEPLFDRAAWFAPAEARSLVGYATDVRVLDAAERAVKKREGKGSSVGARPD